MKNLFRGVILIAGALTFGAVPAWADDDSSASAPGGFVRQVEDSAGAILRVQLNEQGEELVSSAETRVVSEMPTGTDLKAAFDAAPSAAGQPVVTGDSSTSGDSSTWGWYYGRGYGSYYYPYYYRSYYPSYYYYGSYYPYSYYGSYYSYYPYRYYSYYRYW